ncbi:MAG TPA: alpha-E domain-containing protein [Chloroflexota bacterium]|nr:alpha-E domain-containing protein [Chloroflexota bacterium]
MLARVAEDLFWMSRYVERALAVARLIDVTVHLELDDGGGADSDTLWAPLLRPALGSDSGVLALLTAPSPAPAVRDVRHELAFNSENPSSLISLIRLARASARGVRECISSEMWEQLNTLYLWLVSSQVRLEAEENPHGFHRRVREGAQFMQGLADSTLARDEAWHFITLGTYLERAQSVARVLNLETHLLMPAVAHGELDALRPDTSRDDMVRWLAVLRSCGSAEAYARYYSLRVEPARVIEFLLLNEIFPQSVRFSLNAAWEALSGIAGRMRSPRSDQPAARALGLLRARLEHAAVDEVLEEGLDVFLSDVQRRIEVVVGHVTHTYLRHEPQAGRVVGVARAAMIMAAQQQQQQ